jgi:hypothetical protein
MGCGRPRGPGLAHGEQVVAFSRNTLSDDAAVSSQTKGTMRKASSTPARIVADFGQVCRRD